jgi:cation transporter-like permease
MALTDYLVISWNPNVSFWDIVPKEVLITIIACVIILTVFIGIMALIIYTCLSKSIQKGLFIGAFVIWMVLFSIFVLLVALIFVFATRNDVSPGQIITIQT